jgi:hypothetical protein
MWGRALIIWFVLITAEVVHGGLRTIFLEPVLGDFLARQLTVFTGSILILSIACFSVRWIDARSRESLFAVGLIWLVLTLGFEIGVGRFVFGLSWERLGSDYNIREGGLLPLGLIVLTCSPLIAARLIHLREGLR